MFDWAGIHERRTFTLATPPLAFLSLLYGLGVRLRLMAYERIERRSLAGFVISVGNLTLGGTGKTPAACILAEWALSEGYRVAILSRGYGGRYTTEVLEVSDGNDIKTTPVEGGDESYLMAQRLRGVPVVISKRRHLAGSYAHDKFGANFYILDDGFQHLALKRDLDLVLIDALNPFGNGHLLPWGPLREPVEQLKRADAFIITRAGENTLDGEAKGFIEARFQNKPVFWSEHVSERLFFAGGRGVCEPQSLRGKRVIGFAGIGRPEAFKQSLLELGAKVVFFRGFRDHHFYNRGDMRDLINKKEDLKADYLLTTEKDWVRLERLAPEYPDLGYLTIRLSLLDGEERFFGMVKERMRSSGT